jgi:small subunit ribosomal protein S9
METTAPAPTETAHETASHSAAPASGLTLGSGAPAEEAAKTHAAPTIRGRIDRFGVAMGTGRRKTAVARVRIRRGSGKLTINSRPLSDYFHVERNRAIVQRPLEATEMVGKVDIWVRAQGGGTTGQVGAIVLGIARALQAMEPGLHARLSEGGFLTRDGRMVERKKYGKKKARRSFQFSKR